MFEFVKNEIRAIKARDPAARSDIEVLLLYPGLHALIWHRPAHWCYRKGHPLAARALSQAARFFTGIEIHPGARIGKGILIDHGAGVVIGETAVVGDGCTIYQGVTLGGTGKQTGKRHPTLGKNVMVGAGAKILGPCVIGDGAKIASNAVVLKGLPPGATAVGVPARIVRINGKKARDQMDHINIPDPVALEINRLVTKLDKLSKKLDDVMAAEREED